MNAKALFLDLDGTLIDPSWRYRILWSHNLMYPGVKELLDAAVLVGYNPIVVTNQPDIARGVVTWTAMRLLVDQLKWTLPILDVLVCGHDNADNCTCRKPKPGLLRTAASIWELDLSQSLMIGNEERDMKAAQAAGCKGWRLVDPTSDDPALSLAAAREWLTT